MTETEPTLAELEARMMALVKWRDGMIDWAHAIIDWTNEQFDPAALRIGREINRLREQEEKSKPTKPRSSTPPSPSFDGLTDDEIAHYKELLARKG